jgi:AcrR family transcriptional regulator
LSTEIEYSQPVLYKHFSGMEQIAQAVAVDGFAELADVLGAARSGAGTPDDTLTRMARAYLDFARDNPAVYDAMFTRATTLRFAADDTPAQLTAAFEELRQVVDVVADGRDVDALTEMFWATLHGLVTLSRGGRLRPGYDSERLQLLVDQLTRARK